MTNVNSKMKFNKLLLLYNIPSSNCGALKPKFNKATICEITHHNILTQTYTVPQIKEIASAHNLVFIKCKKIIMLQQLYAHLFFEPFIIKLQGWTRKKILQRFNLLHGPAFIHRNNCVNREDFLTFDPIQTINPYESISFQEGLDKNNIYIFTIVSLLELIQQQTSNGIVQFDKILNPYTRQPINISIIKRVSDIYKYGTTIHSINYPKVTSLITESTTLSSIVNFKAIELFQKLEHYSNISWFLSLNKKNLKGFLLELINIWDYRSELSQNTQISLFSPLGKPFSTVRTKTIFRLSRPLLEIQNDVLNILLQFISVESSHIDDKTTIHLYVLGALTVYSRPAAIALPWLYLSIIN